MELARSGGWLGAQLAKGTVAHLNQRLPAGEEPAAAAQRALGLCRPRAGDTAVLGDAAAWLLEGLAGSSSSCPAAPGEPSPSPAGTATRPVWSWGSQGCLCYVAVNLLGR